MLGVHDTLRVVGTLWLSGGRLTSSKLPDAATVGTDADAVVVTTMFP